MNEKLEKAIQYLRERKKYILDTGCRFKPTSSAHTDIAKTINQYNQEALNQPKIKVVKGAKR